MQSINPATGAVVIDQPEISDAELAAKLLSAKQAFISWQSTSFADRSAIILKVAQILRDKKTELSELMTAEMGKPIEQAEAEIEKCAWNCEYFAQNAEKFLADEHIKTEATESYVKYQPLGVILEVMPWNFPLWQVFRVTAPLLMAGNTIVLKHASNVPGCAQAIEDIIAQAAPGRNLLQTLFVGSSKVAQIIESEAVAAVTLTGSEYAGSQVAMTAGKEIKKVVMELGGSDAFIVREDADLVEVAKKATTARLQNNSQSCVAAKRFIVHKNVAQKFIELLTLEFEAVKVGDPMDRANMMGPVVSEKSLEEIHSQVEKSLELGAKLVTGGKRLDMKGAYYPPTILVDIPKGSPAYDEEIFGPVASVFVVESDEEAVALANDHRYGLGCSIWTNDIAAAKEMSEKIEAGGVFINRITGSHPMLPVGGVKKSGYGRELSHIGIKEFTNIKTIWVA